MCPVCQSAIRYDDVRCTSCKVVFHSSCTAVDGKAVDPWLCGSCTSRSDDDNVKEAPLTTAHFGLLMNELAALRLTVTQCNLNTTEAMQMLTAHSQQFAECHAVINELKTENAGLKSRVEALENRFGSAGTSTLTFSEMSKRLDREKNLIVKGVLEDPNTDIQQVCLDILKSVSPRSEIEIVSACRIGRPRPQYTRLIKVVLSNTSSKYGILSNRLRLDGKRFPNVSVLNDLTPLQSTLLKEAREQVRHRRNEGETDLFVKFVDGQPRVFKGKAAPDAASKSKRQREEESSPSLPPKRVINQVVSSGTPE